jgi:hypothetical protein
METGSSEPMTDDLDALVQLAEAAVWKPKPFNDHRDDLYALHDALTPETVLALVRRVREAENKAEKWGGDRARFRSSLQALSDLATPENLAKLRLIGSAGQRRSPETKAMFLALMGELANLALLGRSDDCQPTDETYEQLDDRLTARAEAAEARVQELEAEVTYHRMHADERSDRAEKLEAGIRELADEWLMFHRANPALNPMQEVVAKRLHALLDD